jgi:hypothetical protein
MWYYTISNCKFNICSTTGLDSESEIRPLLSKLAAKHASHINVEKVYSMLLKNSQTVQVYCAFHLNVIFGTEKFKSTRVSSIINTLIVAVGECIPYQ